MIAPELKRNENLQVLLTRTEKARIEAVAKEQNWSSLSFAARTLLLESVERWEKSAPGRRRKK